MLSQVLFYIVILAANIIQGITGFAGTILAMPPSLMLVGYNVAKPVLNALGLLSGIYVLVGNYKKVNTIELVRIVVVMAFGIIGASFIRTLFEERERLMYYALGIFVVALALKGIYEHFFATEQQDVLVGAPEKPGAQSYALLFAAGIIHGLFVCGGPLLISYATRRMPDKSAFRATISTVWIFLNGLIFCQDIACGLWVGPTIVSGLVAVPFLITGMFIGAKLYERMSQELFMKLTYILLLISGLSLLFK